MEYQLTSSSFPIFLSFLLFVLTTIKVMIWKKPKTKTLNLPPGPRKLPLIGNIHLLIGHLPHRRLRDLGARYGPVMNFQLGEVSQFIVSSPDAAKQMMRDNDDCFPQRPRHLLAPIISYNHTDIFLSPYGDYWRRVRKICTMELLSTKRVQSFRSIREEEVANLVASVSSSAAAGSPINFTKMVFSLMNDVTARAAFGWTSKVDQDAFKQVVQKMMVVAGGFGLVDMFPSMKFLEVISGVGSELERLHKEVDKIAESVIYEHRAARVNRNNTAAGSKEEVEDDLVHVLLNHEDQGLTTDNIKAIVLDIFLAGTETSSVLVEWTMSEMLKDPRVLEKVQAEVRKVCQDKGNVDETDLHELHYLKLVIKETLRLHPPAALQPPRECTKACEIMGYDIPVGSRVIVNSWALGRDAKYWAESERFYPERFLNSSIDYKGNHFELIPFGAGRRMCPGIAFGMAVVELPLAQMLYHFDWKLPDGMNNQDLDMTELFGASVRRKNDLYLIPVV